MLIKWKVFFNKFHFDTYKYNILMHLIQFDDLDVGAQTRRLDLENLINVTGK